VVEKWRAVKWKRYSRLGRMSPLFLQLWLSSYQGLPMSTKSIGYSAFIQVTLSQNVLCKCGPPLITQS
ncbi:siroheme synthase domain protein, partial [Vibrio parahaemolyticus EKP-008]